MLLQYLREHNGICDLGDKSEAEDIKRRFQVSKKVYKRAIGDLYKRRLITVEPLSIRLVNENDSSNSLFVVSLQFKVVSLQFKKG